MASDRELLIRISGRLDGSLQSATERAKSQLGSLGSSLSGLAQKAAMGLGAAMAGAIGGAVAVGSKFEAAMSKVQAITNASTDDLKKLEQQAKDLGATTQFSATQAADAMSFLGMAGWKTEQIMAGMPGLLNLSAASGTDLARTADILSNVITGMGLSADQAGHVADVFAYAMSNSNVTVEMLGESMKYAAPVAKAFGASLEDTTALMSMMGDAGIQASQAGTTLRAGLLRLAGPPKKAADALASLGEDTQAAYTEAQEAQQAMKNMGLELTDAAGNMKPMSQILIEMRESMKGMGNAEKMAKLGAIFGTTAVPGWMAVLDAAPEKFDALMLQMMKADGTSERMAITMTNNLKGQMTMFGSVMESIGINIYDKIKAPLTEAMKAVNGALSDMSKSIASGELSASFEKIGTALAGMVTGIANTLPVVLPMIVSLFGFIVDHGGTIISILAGIGAGFAAFKIAGFIAAIGPLITGVTTFVSTLFGAIKAWGVLSTAMGLMATVNPMTWIIIGISALVAAIVWCCTHWDMIMNEVEFVKNKFGEFGAYLQQWASEKWQAIVTKCQECIDGVKGIWDGIKAWFANIGNQAIEAFKKSMVYTKLSGPVNNLINAISTRFKQLVTIISGVWQSIVTTVTGVFTTVQSIISNAINGIISFISARVMAVITIFTNIFNQLAMILTPYIQTFISIVTGIGTGIYNAVVSYLNMVYSFWMSIWNAVVAGFSAYVASIQTAIGYFIDAIGSIIDFVTNVFMGNWTGAWEAVVSAFGSIFSGIQALASAPINAVIALINELIGKINSVSFDIPSWVPGVGGQHFGFDVPSIPALASGGITTGPTTALIGEGSEQEAVLPLSKLSNLISTGSVSGGRSSEPASAPITFAPQITITGNADKDVMAQASQDMFRQFKDFMERYQRENRRFAFSG